MKVGINFMNERRKEGGREGVNRRRKMIGIKNKII